MTTLLQIDASARSGRSGEARHGSHTRRLSHRFVERWSQLRPGDEIRYRDVGARPPRPVSGDWIHAAFTPPALRQPWMQEVLTESDTLVAELKAADVIVIGAPMYNFGPPAPLKAWIDNVVRVGLTFGFDRARLRPRRADRRPGTGHAQPGQAPGLSGRHRRPHGGGRV